MTNCEMMEIAMRQILRKSEIYVLCLNTICLI